MSAIVATTAAIAPAVVAAAAPAAPAEAKKPRKPRAPKAAAPVVMNADGTVAAPAPKKPRKPRAPKADAAAAAAAGASATTGAAAGAADEKKKAPRKRKAKADATGAPAGGAAAAAVGGDAAPEKKVKAPKKKTLTEAQGGPPSRPKTTYMLFCADKRPALAAEFKKIKDANDLLPKQIDATGKEIKHSTGGVPDQAKKLGAMWKASTDEEKKPYVDAHAKDRAIYVVKLAKYKAEVRRKAGPKTAKSAFLFFTASRRAAVTAAHPDAKFPELGKLLGKEWKALSEEQKKPFTEQYNGDKVRFENELVKWRLDNPGQEPIKKAKKAKKPAAAKPTAATVAAADKKD